ncbi:SusC/RagA family TonB-linked outer membrane protein [Niastella populi]|uniref:SusC/RagA family TonB-linked outer membrane protein n=1 Tax=Niastella populi TaxID=550983 RepID=A0A1V9FGW1_9BACT|nr:TonB-dependent receptor [Niastella populi]OQP57570.1 SusC/RagA family TonB-linked outer membrane protein [Niastella populi]
MKKNLGILIVCLLLSVVALAQKTIGGKITDAKSGIPLAAASVTVVGAKSGTGVSTDEKGNFSIKVNSAKAKLMISAVGYKSQIIELNGKTSLAIQLEVMAAVLDDIVVIGYGQQRKSHLTGAVSKVKNENLDEIPTSGLDKTLIGKIAGVTVQNTSSEVASNPRIRVRGLSSISASADPLVVVDGHPVPDGLSMVNAFDVESVEVLKDAASAAIYGSRGANGVIIITTKSGKTNKPKYAVKAYYGQKGPYKLHPIMSTSEYTQKMYNEAAMRAKDPTVTTDKQNLITPQEKARYLVESVLRSGDGTNWQEEALQSASIYNVQMGVSGGKDLRYYVSGNYQSDEGIMGHSGLNRMNFKTKLDGALSKKVKFSVNFNPSYSRAQSPPVNFTDYYRFYSGLPVHHTAATAAFVKQNPQWANLQPGDWAQAGHFSNLVYQGYMPDGTYYNSGADASVNDGKVIPFSSSNNTPKSVAERQSNFTDNYRALTGADITIDLYKGLTLKTQGSAYFNYVETNSFSKRNAKADGDVNRGVNYSKKFIDLLWENTLNYTTSIRNKHNISGLLGFTAQKTSIDESQITGLNLPGDDIQTLNLASSIDLSGTYTKKTPIGLLSYLGRITYDYEGKYLFTASLRTDGSGYFPEGQKYGWFPAVSAGWRISSEPFMEDIRWLSNLKVRSSYGATGNNKIEPFSYLELLNIANYAFGAGTGTLGSGLAANNDVLPNILTWERTFQYDAGIDVGLFGDRITMSLEYYNGVTDRLLYKQAAMSFSGSNQYWNNIGKVRNQGLELELSSVNVRKKNWQWSTMLNVSGNRNRLLQMGGEPFQYNYGERNEIYASIVGRPSVQFFGYKTDGVWTSDQAIADAKAAGYSSAMSKYFVAGGLKFVDVTGDKIIDEADRTVLGKPFPDFTWGITNTVKYKSFDVTFVIQGVQGASVLNGDAYYNESKWYNKNYNTGGRWVSAAFPGDGKTPYASNGSDWMLTDHVIENGSYAALRSCVLGYSLPAKQVKRMKLNGIRMYAAGENLFYIMSKNYRGINPEARTTSGAYASPLIDGYQRGGFPIGRTVTMGIDINF